MSSSKLHLMAYYTQQRLMHGKVCNAYASTVVTNGQNNNLHRITVILEQLNLIRISFREVGSRKDMH